MIYANPGYATTIEGLPQSESDQRLEFLFEHQLQSKYQYAHSWNEGDVLMFDDLVKLHNAVPDYRPEEPRLIKRCQVMADRVFGPDFLVSSEHLQSAGPQHPAP